ncbi:fumarylacetoacetate hydrolase family protein [Bacillus sp. MUM 116]|uniref:fumarylacetoacetate hydrolase family protein n=1 Tax=Bacillus sp. MUM 116 TaxID=1678002 RepID=UPI0009F450D3|nr:fumarylacetoacetate hydrolase family protein [Bacillus sp. MUM 116]
MRFVSFETKPLAKYSYGIEWDGKIVIIAELLEDTQLVKRPPTSMADFIEDHEFILPLIYENWSAWFESGLLDEFAVPSESVKLLAPLPRPRREVICLGLNYEEHIEQNSKATGAPYQLPEVPVFFAKPASSVIGSNDFIHLDPTLTNKLDYEIELCFVIGKRGRNIPVTAAMDHVFGYTILNDISARDLQFRVSQFYQGKGLDTFCPVGPAIVDKGEITDPHSLFMTLRVNGEVRQEISTSSMLFQIPEIIAAISEGFTLEPGDIIATATPGGCGYASDPPRFLKDGDVVECEIQPIGVLTNRVKKIERSYEL